MEEPLVAKQVFRVTRSGSVQEQSGVRTFVAPIDLELDFLTHKCHDLETVALVCETRKDVNAHCKFKEVLRLQQAIEAGNWPEAMASGKILAIGPMAELALKKQVARELLREHGLSVGTWAFMLNDVSDPDKILSALLKPESGSPQASRGVLVKEVLGSSGYEGQLQQLLDHALRFESVVEDGTTEKTCRADVPSYVYSDVYLRVLGKSNRIGCIQKLEILCAKVKKFNQFNEQSLTDSLQSLLKACMETDHIRTIELLRNSRRFTQSLEAVMPWSPIGSWSYNVSGFNFVEEYSKRRLPDLPAISSAIELGSVMQSIHDSFSVKVSMRFDAEGHAMLPEYTPLREFPLRPVAKICLAHPVWSVASSSDGGFIVAGVKDSDPDNIMGPKGAVHIFKRQQGEFWRYQKRVSRRNAPERIGFHPARPVFVDCTLGNFSYTDCEATGLSKSFGTPGMISRYGHFCWHSGRDDALFYTTDNRDKLRLREIQSGCKISEWDLPLIPLAISSSEQHIVILTSAIGDLQQHLLIFNHETLQLSDVRLPSLPDDGVYTALQASRYDPRTILLVGSPNVILLLDKYGKRKPRLIFASKFTNSVAKAQFCGPMDKYILVTSEDCNAPKALILDRFTGKVVQYLEGHRKQVNDVAWIPAATADAMPEIVTASDDTTLIIYG